MNILENINNSYLILKDAISGHTKQIAYECGFAGKKITASGVEKWGVGLSDTVRTNWLKQAKQALYGLYKATPAGFEFVWIELNLFVRELQREKVKFQMLPRPVMEEVIQIEMRLERIKSFCGEI